MKLQIAIEVDDELVKNHREMSSLIKMIACDIQQGHSGGFIRNPHTGSESNRWELNVVLCK